MTTKAELIGYIIGMLVVVAFSMYVIGNIVASPAAQVAEQLDTVMSNCTEDMDCWDCETMGNLICGPLKEDQ